MEDIMKVKVRNYRTGENNNPPSCRCKTWINHWNKNRYHQKKIEASYCRCCNEKILPDELVGGHVIKVFERDSELYIVPLCNKCNNAQNDKYFDVDSKDLIPANPKFCLNK